MDRHGPDARGDLSERQWRVTAAFFESAIATSASLEALMGRLYRRDPDTLAHVSRVRELSHRIGRQLGVASRALDDLERAALLHDVGRLALSAAAAGTGDAPLDRVALRQRAEQVSAAYEMLKHLPFLRPAAVIVRSSLECFDGSGYPLGLGGRDIPLGSRVLHVADTLDALTSVCLSLSCPTETVSAELVRLAGTRFDPDVVAAWLRVADDVPAVVLPWWAAVPRMH